MLARQNPGSPGMDNRKEILEYLMKRFGDKVLKLSYYYVRDRHQAEDIAQDVFCKVYEKLDSFRGGSSYYTWIYKITVNKCRDYLASSSFKRLLPWGNLSGMYNQKRLTDTNRLLERVEGGELFSKVMDLPTKYRMVVVLYYFEGMTTVEIATVLSLKESTVRTRLCRAREMLKKTLAGEEYV